MFGWLKSLFGNTAAPPDADDTAETPPADVIQLAAERDYRAPDQAPYTDPSDTKTYRQAHRAGWEFFAQGSYSYLGPDGRPNGEVLGRGKCERDYDSAAERAGFTAGFEQAMKLHFQRVREAVEAFFAEAGEDEV